jgi:hypothetical protein
MSGSGGVHVFVGPSLPRSEVLAVLPAARVHPPVAHGDLPRLPVERGDTVVIVDGVFQQAASVRHKEILDLLGHGVHVLGAASMGALRAAELGRYGMTGHGVVHRLYALGVLDADDEVALLHDDTDRWTARTAAMVSVRVLARRCRIRRTLTGEQERLLLAAASDLHFTARSWSAVLHRAEERGLPASVADHLGRLVRRPAHEWDIKAQDVSRVLSAARHLGNTRHLDHTERPGRTTPAPPGWPVTGYLARWRQPPDTPTSMLVTAAQLYAPDYPILHYRTILTAIATEDEPVPADLPLPALERAALHAADRRVLFPCGGTAVPDAQRCRTLVRTYRWAPNHAPLAILHGAIQATPGVEKLHRIVEAAHQLNAYLQQRGHLTDTVSRTAVHKVCQRYWHTGTLEPTMHDHGFVDHHDLERRARPLVPLGILQPPEPTHLLS